jgi:hypothetical protein
MNYSFNLITLPAQCDSLIKIAERDKRTILARKQSLSVRAENSAEDVSHNIAELAILNAQVAAHTASIATMPDGPEKEKEITKKMDMEVRIRKMNEGELTPMGQLERQYDIAQMDAQLLEIDAFIAAVAAHKATL